MGDDFRVPHVRAVEALRWSIPPSLRMLLGKEFKPLVDYLPGFFMLFIGDSAAEQLKRKKKKTITDDYVLDAMSRCGFDALAQRVRERIKHDEEDSNNQQVEVEESGDVDAAAIVVDDSAPEEVL